MPSAYSHESWQGSELGALRSYLGSVNASEPAAFTACLDIIGFVLSSIQMSAILLPRHDDRFRL